MRKKVKAVDLYALVVGGVVALGAALTGLLGIAGHNLLFADPAAGTGQGTETFVTEGLIFHGTLIVGLPVATFVSVWRGRAAALTQGAAAVVLHWTLAFGLGGAMLTSLPGGSADIADLFFMLSPGFLSCQAVAATVAWLVARIGSRQPVTGSGVTSRI